MYESTTVTMFLDYKCNFACGHCSVGSSPETTFEMPEETWEEAFREVADLSPDTMVFTGGEVTLHKERLLESLERADDLGIGTRIVTNGWWAHDMESAREMVDELAEAGLDEMNTSYDDFHTDYMEPEPVVNLVEASHERDEIQQVVVACIVGDEEPTYDRDRLESLIEDRLGTPVSDIDGVNVVEDSAVPMGSGAQLDVSNVDARNKLRGGCNDIVTTVSIHPDGSVKGCCGHAQWYVPDLTLGTLEEESLSEIIDRSQRNIVYWLIHEVGPKTLIDDRLDVEDDTDHTGICHACHDLLNDHRDAFLDYVRENKQEIIAEDIIKSDELANRVSDLMEVEDELREQIRRIKDASDGGDDRVMT